LLTLPEALSLIGALLDSEVNNLPAVMYGSLEIGRNLKQSLTLPMWLARKSTLIPVPVGSGKSSLTPVSVNNESAALRKRNRQKHGAGGHLLL